MILDEAQAIKNATTESAKAARLLRGDHRLALSGTPIENHLGELWSLFEFLNPGMLGAASAFGADGSAARSLDRDAAAVARPRPAPVHPAAHEGAGGAGPARQDRADAVLRAGARAAKALRRAARSLPRGAARPGRARRARAVEDPGARGPAPAPPGRLPSRPARPRAARRVEREARRAPAPARRGPGGGAQGARLLAVHELSRHRARGAGRARASPTSTSTAGRATAPRGWSASRPTPTACSSSSA